MKKNALICNIFNNRLIHFLNFEISCKALLGRVEPSRGYSLGILMVKKINRLYT
jgi:hypothetical protein